MELLLLPVFVIWGAPILLCWGLGRSRDRPGGWAYGLLLSWLGVLILACMRPVSEEERRAKPKQKSFRLSR